MKDVMEMLGLTVGLVVWRLGEVVWGLLKIILGLCVVIGAGMEIFKGFTIVRYEGMVWYGAVWQGILDLGSNVVDNWMAFAVLMLFFWVIGLKSRSEELESHVTQMKICLVALLNYLEVEVETSAMKEVEEKGLWKMIETRWTEGVFIALFMGKSAKGLLDDTLTAKAVRDGSEVNLREDMANYAGLKT